MTIAAGGASANTTKGVGHLGGSAAFIGVVSGDQYGKEFQKALEEESVSPELVIAEGLTGNAITYITPDGERTFTVHLGVASLLTPAHIDEEIIKKAKVVHLEAFQFEAGTKDMLDHVIALAKQHGTLVSLDLNDASLIERNFDLFHQVLKEDIDIVFANESESLAFTKEADEHKAAQILGEHVQIAVVKRGEAGSVIAEGETITEVPAAPTEVVDTTGAGDMYAAGFLQGLTGGMDLAAAGHQGATLASRVIARVGTELG